MIKCMLDSKSYLVKPQGKEIGAITNRLEKSQVEISIKNLADKLIKGVTFKPSLLNGKKETDWVQSQLFALDFDENTTIEIELERCKDLNIFPCFGYTSFSHTEENHKFRLVFCTDEVISSYEIALRLQLTLMSIFENCDEKCKNLSRLYFGGRKLIYEGFDNTMDYRHILDKYSDSSTDKLVVLENIPQDNIDIANTFIIMGDKTPTVVDSYGIDYYNIKALRDRNSEYLKAKINNPKIILENNQAFFDYIKTYDLGRLLELKHPTSFRCILHEDNSPSAGIFQNEEGTFIYHCFSCGKSYNIINLIEVLGNFQSRPKAYKFIREIFNLTIMETEWQTEQKLLIQENRRVLLNGTLEEKCPTTYANIKRNMRYLEQMLMIAEDNIYSEKFLDATGNSVVFYASTKYICKTLGMSENSAKEVSKKNVLFAYHNLINKIADNEIPEEMLKRSQAINANSPNKNKKHINFYSIPSYTTNWIEDNEEKGITWKDNGYNMTGCSREMFFRTEGKVVADKLYPQYKQVYDISQAKVVDRTTTKKSENRTDKIVEILFDILSVRTYATEKEIIDELSSDGDIQTTKKEAEKQVKKSLQEILLSYDLKKIRCNKLIKEQYNVDAEGYPFLIVKN